MRRRASGHPARALSRQRAALEPAPHNVQWLAPSSVFPIGSDHSITDAASTHCAPVRLRADVAETERRMAAELAEQQSDCERRLAQQKQKSEGRYRAMERQWARQLRELTQEVKAALRASLVVDSVLSPPASPAS